MQRSPGRSLQGNGEKVIFGNRSFFYLEGHQDENQESILIYMKEVILKLENNKTISTKDIKCPVCGRLMEIDHSEVNSYDCSSSISLEQMPAPFEGTMVKRRNDYTTRFKCPNECCHLEMKHYIENILF